MTKRLPSLMIFDDFYGSPMAIREHALSLPFGVKGNFPGVRTDITKGSDNKATKLLFEYLIGEKITWWPEEYNTAFQYTTAKDESWIHYDTTHWAGVIYLTPDAPLDSGTAIYRNKESKIHTLDRKNPKSDYPGENNMEDWEPIVQVSNIFNRLVIYRGEYYHRSMLPGFGDNQFNGRLFQTFFFNTKV